MMVLLKMDRLGSRSIQASSGLLRPETPCRSFDLAMRYRPNRKCMMQLVLITFSVLVFNTGPKSNRPVI